VIQRIFDLVFGVGDRPGFEPQIADVRRCTGISPKLQGYVVVELTPFAGTEPVGLRGFGSMASVTATGGRTVAVHPLLQMVDPMLAWVTTALISPGVHAASGNGCPFRVPA